MILAKGNIKEINIDEFIDSKINSNQLDKIILVVPTNRKLRDLKKKIIDNFTQAPLNKIYIETLSTLTTKVLKEFKNFTTLSEAASTILIKECVEELELSYFSAYSRGVPFGTLDKIKNVISEYKKHGIKPFSLLKESEKLLGGEKNKAIDIAKIYDLYLQKTNILSALEIGDIYSSILEINENDFLKIFSELFGEFDQILLDGFDEFTNSELKIIEKISKSLEIDVIINFDYFHGNYNLFTHLEDTYNSLLEIGFKQIEDKTPIEQFGFRKAVRSNLFQYENYNPNSKFKDIIFKASVNSRIEEIELIAKNIKQQILDEKISPENICVAFNLITNYSSLVRDIFTKYKIPINLTDRIPLKTSPPVIAAIGLLELVENDFYYNDLVRLLSNKFFQIDNIDLNNLLFVANNLKIKSGLQNWKNSINDALIILKYQSDINFLEKNKIEAKYKKALFDINYLSEIIAPLNKKLDYNEFLLIFKKILLKLKLPYTVLENAKNKEEEFIKSLTVFLQTLNEVLILLGKEKNEKQSLSFYIDHIRTISNWARFNVKEKSDQGVLVTSVNEIRGLKFDYLYLGGMCDGDFPTKYSPEIFFSGSFRKKELIHQTEERYHFYQTLCCWNKKIFLTIPQKDSESELVESTFIKDLEKVFEFSQSDSDETKIFSKEQLQINYSQNKSNAELRKIIEKNDLAIEKLDDQNKIRIERNKNPFTEYEYNGFLSKDENIKNYLKAFSEREFSISQLEIFAKCPFKYFAERILKLEPIEEPTEEAEPIELGNVLHSILYEFYNKVVNEKIEIGNLGTKEFNNLKSILFEIAEEKISNLNLKSPLAFFEKEKILGINGQKENSILFKFLIEETKENSLKPELFEVEFGNFYSENKNGFPPLQIDNLKLRGKIDRIDIDHENKIFNVIDYKLKGKKPTIKDLMDGISLQLPVYLLAGKQILSNIYENDLEGNEMIIYSLHFKDDNFGPSKVNLTRKRNLSFDEKVKLNKELTDQTEQKISEYHQNIIEGKFHLSPLEDRDDKICKYCDFRSFCRLQEVFVA
ncbi:MAG: exodeoxyribonuclease V subunit gamma [Ignavibacteriales bacterium]|nr:exodeoxyribonuclease V subunit gamma [Ignavibacteriales bacterium]